MFIIEIHDKHGVRLGFVRNGEAVIAIVEATRYPDIDRASAWAADMMRKAKELFPYENEVYFGLCELS